MTDKQIIIDDLKEMIYKLQKECAEKTDNILALGEQLKTAETVIEILEAKIGGHEYAISDIVKEYQGKLDKLKEENDTLFKAIEEVNKINKRLETENEDLKIYIESNEQQVKEVETLVMDNDRLINELDQLKQTLAEIKEFCIDHTQLIHDAYPYLNIILDKINEVEDDRT